ncbi:MAG TPA: flippase-like domain-containing protein [Methanocorpusculum sp.]|nr:flippase-like domain-containing protein [Methanocorpusculum sp.]
MNKAQKRWLILSISISLAVILVVLFITFDPESTFEALQKANPWIIVLAFAMHVVSLLFWALRIKLMCRSLGYKIGFGHTFRLVCSNMFIASVTPSQVGGEPVRVYEIHKAGVPAGDATAVVIMERVFDGIVLVFCTIISVILLALVFTSIQLPQGWIYTAYAAAVLFAVLLGLFFIISKKPELGKKLCKKVTGFFIRKWDFEKNGAFQAKLEGGVENFYTTLGHFTGKSRSGMAYGMFFSTLYWINEFIITYVVILGLGVPFSLEAFFLSFIFQILITVILMIPLTPGGAGIAEVSLAGFYAFIVPSSVLGIFVVIWRLIMYYFNLAVGFIASLLILHREAKGEPNGT